MKIYDGESISVLRTLIGQPVYYFSTRGLEHITVTSVEICIVADWMKITLTGATPNSSRRATLDSEHAYLSIAEAREAFEASIPE